jgi:hypothetical protein
LFKIYFTQLQRHLPLLDPAIHTPQATQERTPFLFTCSESLPFFASPDCSPELILSSRDTVCSVASRYYPNGPADLHEKCLEAALKEGYASLRANHKSIDIVQGFILLTAWNHPSKRYEEAMSCEFLCGWFEIRSS